MKLVCIPEFNEEKTIGKIVEQSLQYADYVIVCNDGSTDKTEKKAKEKGAIIINHNGERDTHTQTERETHTHPEI